MPGNDWGGGTEKSVGGMGRMVWYADQRIGEPGEPGEQRRPGPSLDPHIHPWTNLDPEQVKRMLALGPMGLDVKDSASHGFCLFPSDRSEKALEVVEPAYGEHARFGISHFRQL